MDGISMKQFFVIGMASLVVQAFALTVQDAEARLQMAMQLAREHNDSERVAQIQVLGDRLKNGLTEDAESKIRVIEKAVGIDPGGWFMAGLPLAKPTPEMLARSKEWAQRLHEAMLTDDAARVHAVTTEILDGMGDQAGVPDGRPRGVFPQETSVTQAESTTLFLNALKSEARAVRQLSEGKPLPDQMLRIYGYLLTGLAEMRPWIAKYESDSLADVDALAAGCAKIMISLQQPTGYFPFPDLRGKNIRFGEMIERQVQAGQVVVKDGWVITEDSNGGSQFDTGICGVALLRAGEAFGKESWLAAGKKAADWALQENCCGNFNYNAFSVSLLAHQFRLSRDERYLQGALKKVRVGIAPGLAPNGRWLDSHNARTVYHVIILRALGDLASVMPDPFELNAIALPAIKALLDEFDIMGITVEALPELVTLQKIYPDNERLKKATARMASFLIQKCSQGARAKMAVQPHQLAAVAGSNLSR